MADISCPYCKSMSFRSNVWKTIFVCNRCGLKFSEEGPVDGSKPYKYKEEPPDPKKPRDYIYRCQRCKKGLYEFKPLCDDCIKILSRDPNFKSSIRQFLSGSPIGLNEALKSLGIEPDNMK